MAYGLYEVVPGRIYQVRGFDLANISFIKGDTGWIVFDPLTAQETSRAALEFINEKLGKRPVVAVVYSHSHGDHFGGVRGVVDEADVASGKVMLIAADGFMEAAISENVFAGNAMNRRMQWQYAVLLQRDPYGHVDQAIGKNVAAGSAGLIAPNRLISKDFEEITLDGVTMVFQNAPGHRGAGTDEHVLPAVQGVLGRGDRHGHDPQHLHDPRRRGAQRAQLVEGDQRRAVQVRPGGRGDVRLAQLAALGQRSHPGGAARRSAMRTPTSTTRRCTTRTGA